MAIIDDLIKQINDDSLRERIQTEVDKLTSRRNSVLSLKTTYLNILLSMTFLSQLAALFLSGTGASATFMSSKTFIMSK